MKVEVCDQSQSLVRGTKDRREVCEHFTKLGNRNNGQKRRFVNSGKAKQQGQLVEEGVYEQSHSQVTGTMGRRGGLRAVTKLGNRDSCICSTNKMTSLHIIILHIFIEFVNEYHQCLIQTSVNVAIVCDGLTVYIRDLYLFVGWCLAYHTAE